MVYSKILELINGVPRTVDLSTNTLSVQGLQINAATGGGNITFAAHSTTSSYSIVWPQAQAASSGYVLTNDGAGNLSWAAAASPLTFSDSLVNTAGNVTLVGDGTPTASQYYGTNGSSVLGYYNLPAPGTGTVTSVSVVSANGFTGTVATDTTTPAITLTGTLSGDVTGDLTSTALTATTNSTLTTLSALSLPYSQVTGAPGGTVTSVALLDGSSNPIYNISGSPVTTMGTLEFTLQTQAANMVFAGPPSGSAAQPAFRDLVAADIPDISATYVTQSEVGAASGVASLDGSGKVPLSQLPSTLMEFKGSWNPNTNTPTLVDGTGTTGFTYWVSAAFAGPVAGLTDPSMSNFQIGDLVIYNGTKWVLVTPAAGTQSVNGAQGAVVLTMASANGFAGTYSGTALTVSTTLTTPVVAANGTALVAATTTGSGSTVVLATSPTLITPALGTPSAIVLTNATGTAAGLTAGTVTTNANLTGVVTSVGNATTLTTSAFDQTTIGGGAGTPAYVISAPVNSSMMIAGQTFAANTSYAVRMSMSGDAGFVAGQVVSADDNANTTDNFWVIGIAFSAAGVSQGSPIAVVSLGTYTFGSGDTGFTGTAVAGKPVYLASSGGFTMTPPSTSGYANFKIGNMETTTKIFVLPQMMGIA